MVADEFVCLECGWWAEKATYVPFTYQQICYHCGSENVINATYRPRPLDEEGAYNQHRLEMGNSIVPSSDDHRPSWDFSPWGRSIAERSADLHRDEVGYE